MSVARKGYFQEVVVCSNFRYIKGCFFSADFARIGGRYFSTFYLNNIHIKKIT